MKLEKIGFYTLSDDRVRQANVRSPLWRCELLLTNVCNFNCPYCRGRSEPNFTHTYEEAQMVVEKWVSQGLKNIRFSGGEPTLWAGDLNKLVSYTKNQGVERIAISTNGSRKFEIYKELIRAGVNDFSISLDACCADTGDSMSGGISGSWKIVVENIKRIAAERYTTVGVVLTEDNIAELNKIVEFAHSLGVHDIRVITAAQWNRRLVLQIDEIQIEKHPILKYRLRNLLRNRDIRGIRERDSNRCPLVLDDMAVWKGKHYPCIIYLREGGSAIGSMTDSIEHVRRKRELWYQNHDTHRDTICSRNCLDVCVDYNNKWARYNLGV